MSAQTVEIVEEEILEDQQEDQEAEDAGQPEWDAEVQVLNDDGFPADKVIAAFCEVLPGCGFAKAMKMMVQIHRHGVGTVWQGAREICELYAEQLNARGLDARVA